LCDRESLTSHAILPDPMLAEVGQLSADGRGARERSCALCAPEAGDL
jgi:hypothetical protein